jgi:oligopeptide/dipeptide ABC transporter ATP-binding protein
MPETDNRRPVLEVHGLNVVYASVRGELRAVSDLNFRLRAGEILGVVGESGAGKTQAALALLGLLPASARVTGSALLDGEELIGRSGPELTGLRGDQLSIVFQDPLAALNPYLPVGLQLTEVLRLHRGASRREAREQALEMLAAVGIDMPRERLESYSFELSGGMRQRVALAMALLCRPRVLIADEVTTALDVTVQAQILRLLLALRGSHYGAGILISHDLAVIAQVCDRVLVMYAGRIMEEAPVDVLFHASRHPYTRALLRSLPRLDRPTQALEPIPGQAEGEVAPLGCVFSERCREAVGVCRQSRPPLVAVGPEHASACHLERPA